MISFLYADDLLIALQDHSFEKVDQSLTDIPDRLSNYYVIYNLR